MLLHIMSYCISHTCVAQGSNTQVTQSALYHACYCMMHAAVLCTHAPELPQANALALAATSRASAAASEC
jgi:hypothetical protein